MTVTLAQLVAALSVTYKDDAVLIWLTSRNRQLPSKPDGSWSCSPQEYIACGLIDEVADAVRRIGDADPADFVLTEHHGDDAAEPTLYCYIDDCHQKASLVIPSYPDTVRLCADHAHLHTPEPWEKR